MNGLVIGLILLVIPVVTGRRPWTKPGQAG